MKYKTTLLLVVLVALLSTTLWFVRDNGSTPGDATSSTKVEQGSPVFAVDALPSADIATITVEARGKQIIFTREGQEWFQTQPVRFPMNQWSMQQLIDDTAKLRYADKLTPGQAGAPSLDAAKLDTPETIVTLNIAGTKPRTVTIKLGRRTVGGYGFMMLEGDPSIYIVGDALHRMVQEQKVETWRKRNFESPSAGRAERITLTQSEGDVDIIKTDGRWQFTGTNTGRVNVQSVTSMLDKVTSIYASSFVAESPYDASLYGLDKPSLVITIVGTPSPASDPSALLFGNQPKPEQAPAEAPAKPRVTTFTVGSPADLKKSGYFVTWDDHNQKDAGSTVFVVSTSIIDHFRRTSDEVRDPRITLAADSNIRAFTIAPRQRPVFTLQRQPEGWEFADPKPSFDPDGGDVSKLLATITDMAAESFLAGDDFEKAVAAAGEPVLTLTLSAIGQRDPEVVRFYVIPDPAGGERRLAVRNDEKVGQVFTPAQVDPLFLTTQNLRDRAIVTGTTRDLKRITIQQTDGVTQAFERIAPPTSQPASGGEAEEYALAIKQWKLVGDQPFDDNTVAAILEYTAPHRVEAWLADDAVVPEPDITLTLESHDGTKQILHINSKTAQGTKDGVKSPFKLESRMITLFNAEMRRRAMVALNRQDIVVLEIGDLPGDGGSRQWLRLERNMDNGRFEPATPMDLDLKSLDMLLDGVAALTATRWLPQVPDAPPGRVIKVTLDDDRVIEIGLAGGPNGVPTAILTADKRAAQIPPELFEVLNHNILSMGDKPAGPKPPDMPFTVPKF